MKVVKCPEFIEKLVSAFEERVEYGDESLPSSASCIIDTPLQRLYDNKATYHSECYKAITNKSKIDRLKMKAKSSNPSAANETQSKESCSQQNPRPNEQSKRDLRSSNFGYDKQLCVICQKKGGTLRKVMYKEMGVNMLLVAKAMEDKAFFIRLNTIPNACDAVANDVMYHLACWVMAQRAAKDDGQQTENIEDISRVLADIEIVNTVRSLLKENPETILTMNDINQFYNALLDNDSQMQNFKQYLKRLLEGNIANIVFHKPRNRNESERVCFNDAVLDAVEQKYACDEFLNIFECASTVRQDILEQKPWIFEGDFEGFTVPKSLHQLIKWIVLGAKHKIGDSVRSLHEADIAVDNICQIIMKTTKTTRQVRYKPAVISNTPFAVGLGLHIHKETRSKKIIDCLSELCLTINYDKVMKIETEIANAATKIIRDNDGVFIPPTVTKGTRIHFAIDNTDFHNDTPDGKLEFHGTGQILFQKRSNQEKDTKLKIERSSSSTIMFKQNPFEHAMQCSKPTPPRESFPFFTGKAPSNEIQLYQSTDQCWAICQVVNEEKIMPLPSWAAYNSLVSENCDETLCQGMPLYPGSPTDWSNLYTALKIAQGINVKVTGSKKTIISLDLQLYSKAMQLREKAEIREDFIFRLGELHVVFAMLKCIGKYIEDSGLDRLFTEAGIYGENTLSQILSGKHYKRAMEAHTTMYLALFRAFFQKFYKTNLALADLNVISQIQSEIDTFQGILEQGPGEECKNQHNDILHILDKGGIFDHLQAFENGLDNQAQFLRNYMKMFESLLRFIRASRQSLWQLHLSSLNEFVQYFFAHDQLNYARLSPLYLATMQELQNSDADSWSYLQENFSICKSGIPFTAIGSDHAMEQENKALKVIIHVI